MVQPLAARLRPTSLDDFVGQTHLVGPSRPLRFCIEQCKLHSMILWGPPGSGKTTLGQLIANYCQAEFITLSAVMAGVKDIREAISLAKDNQLQRQLPTILFIDEIHRFNKNQQDALLPFVEDGTVYLIGATTENPSFEINSALLSRTRVYVLKSLTFDDLKQILLHALSDKERGLGKLGLKLDEEAIENIVSAADGDARRLLTILEIVSERIKNTPSKKLTPELIEQVVRQDYRRFDKQGDVFYEQISALHKSIRGSSPDGALYWLARMLDGGGDPAYIARRIVRAASEDIGNADPRALTIALDAWNTLERLGAPEGALALAQAAVYLACAPKSNATYIAFNQATEDVQNGPSYSVPIHLRNAPTQLMKKLGYGKAYRYDHSEPDAFARGQTYFPDEMGEQRYYYPVNRGLEIKISEKLSYLREGQNFTEPKIDNE